MARLVDRATVWRWSSVHAQLSLIGDDGVTDCAAVRARYPDFAGHIAAGEDEALSAALRRAESSGRPLGDAAFLHRLEEITGRPLTPGKRGPKPKTE